MPHYGLDGSDGLFSCELEGLEELEKTGLRKDYNIWNKQRTGDTYNLE